MKSREVKCKRIFVKDYPGMIYIRKGFILFNSTRKFGHPELDSGSRKTLFNNFLLLIHFSP